MPLPPPTSTIELTTDEQYHRQQLIEHLGQRWDQERVHNGRVLLCGGGNIGAHAAVALAEVGISFDVVDLDVVSVSNLSRGAGIFRPEHIGKPKATVLAEEIGRIYPGITVHGIVADLRWQFGTARYGAYDVVLLATHDPVSRSIVNKAVHLVPGRTVAIVDAAIGILSFSAQTILVGKTPCYACGYPPAQLADAGVYQSCSGVVTERTPVTAATNALDGMAAAALMVREAALVLAGLEPLLAGVELHCEMGVPSLIQNSWRRTCSAHVAADRADLLQLPYDTNASLAEVRAMAAQALGVPADVVQLFSRELRTLTLTCKRCRSLQAVMRPQRVPLAPVCLECGNTDPEQFRPETSFRLTERADASRLSEFGIPDGHILELYADDQHRYLLPAGSLPEEVVVDGAA